MRILVFGMSGTLLGGIETFLLNMNAYMSADCVFDYVILGDKCIHDEAILRKGGKVFHITSYRENPVLYIADTIRVLREYKSRGNTAYFNLFSMCHVSQVLIARAMGYRIVLHSHNNNVASKSQAYRALHFFNRWLLRRMDCVRLTNSPASGDFMFGNVKSEMIYNAIDVSAYRFELETRKRIRAELRIEDKLVFGFVGRLMTQKNPLFLIEIFHSIHAQMPNAVLLIVGDGNLREMTENKVMELGLVNHVMFLGNRSDANALYQAMDVFLLPSLFEGLGIVLIEAQAAGLPCVTSADVVPWEAKVSDLLDYVSLDLPASEWACVCVEKATELPQDRSLYAGIVRGTSFNIEKEAIRLENILKDASHE